MRVASFILPSVRGGWVRRPPQLRDPGRSIAAEEPLGGKTPWTEPAGTKRVSLSEGAGTATKVRREGYAMPRSAKLRRRTLTLRCDPYAAFSGRNTRWNRGPVNCTPTRCSPGPAASQTCTTRPLVAKSASLRREA